MPPTAYATREEFADLTNSAGDMDEAVVLMLGTHDPNVRQERVMQDPDTGPADPVILQCPSTASSGRKLTATTFGGS